LFELSFFCRFHLEVGMQSVKDKLNKELAEKGVELFKGLLSKNAWEELFHTLKISTEEGVAWVDAEGLLRPSTSYIFFAH